MALAVVGYDGVGAYQPHLRDGDGQGSEREVPAEGRIRGIHHTNPADAGSQPQRCVEMVGDNVTGIRLNKGQKTEEDATASSFLQS